MDVKWAPGAFERFESQFGKVIDAFSKKDFGTVIVTKDGIFFIDLSRKQSQWDRFSWASEQWWDEYGMPDTDYNGILDRAKAFFKVANELTMRDVHYLGHPVVGAWIKYNQEFIVFMGSLGFNYSDGYIRQARDHLEAVGGTAAVNCAAQLVKETKTIRKEQQEQLKHMVKPLHDEWWELRKLNNPAERKRRLSKDPY